MNWISKNKEISILFSAALAFRLYLVFTAGGIATDGCSYAWLAQEIAKGNFNSIFDSNLPPLFSSLIAAASFIFKDFELSGRVISVLFGSLTIFPLYLLAKNIFDKKAAIITILFYAIHPYLAATSAEVLTEAMYIFFVTSIAAISCLASSNKKSLPFIFAGFLSFLAFLTRYEGLFLVFLIFSWIWLFNLPKIKADLKWKFVSSFWLIGIFIVFLIPTLFSIRQHTGKWQVGVRQQQYEQTFFNSANIEHTNIENNINLFKYKIKTDVPPIPYCFAKAYFPVFLPLLFFGLFYRRNYKGYRAGESFMASYVLLRIFELLIFAGIIVRYFYAFVPMALCWAGAGFWEIDYRLRGKYKNKNLMFGQILINRHSITLLIIITAAGLIVGLKPIRSHRAIQKEVGVWLKQNSDKKDFVITASSPQESFYAGAKWNELKGCDYSSIINNARAAKADFIIVDKKTDDRHPDFRTSIKPNDLEIFTKQFENSSRKIIIYKLKK